jgi:hypothetical protein
VDTPQMRDSGRLAARLALILAIVAAIAVLFLPLARDSYDDPGGPGVRWTSLIEQQGPSVVVLAAFPVLLSAIPVVGERFRPGSRGLRILAAVFLWLFVVLGLASIGWFFAPSALAMTLAAVARRRRTDEPQVSRAD